MNEQAKLLSQIDRYWECDDCGRVISDPALAKNLRNAGAGWGCGVPCQKCSGITSKHRFPDERFRPIFEMIVESYQSKRAILVLVLAQSAFEGLLDDFLVRLLGRMNCPVDIETAIGKQLKSIDAKTTFIKSLTGKKFGKIIEDVGFKDMLHQLEKIKKERNRFLHTGGAKKDVNLDEINETLNFASSTIDLYAALFSEYREWQPLLDSDENSY